MGFALAVAWLLASGLIMVATADVITLRNGMQTRGVVGKIGSVVENAQSKNSDPAAPTPIVITDDSLRRTYVSARQIRTDGLTAENPSVEKIRISQRKANSTKRIGAVGPVLKITPFDEFGRRVYTMQTGQGPLSVIQGITEVTPLYTKVEGLHVEQALQWDMRVATQSIPRDTLSKVLKRQLDAKNPDQRLRLVRLYTQAERFEDARQELADIIHDFPDLAEFSKQTRELLQLSAGQLIREAELRKAVGQHQLVTQMLGNFPTEGIAGETLIKVRETLQEYQDQFQQGQNAVKRLDELAKRISDDANRTRVDSILKEIKAELNFNTLTRLADYLRLADEENLSPEQRLSLALSGWLLGGGGGTDNLAVALSTADVRELVRKYLRSRNPADRKTILDQLVSMEGASPANVARILAHMKPPIETPPNTEEGVPPGFYTLSVPGISEQADFTYHVQLPPEYDPLRRYPCIITLGGTGLTAREQLRWWTGRYDEQLKMHLGQASRQGYIVMAPEWVKEQQRSYEYSAREHAAVLFTLRDACRRFSIDSDRIFLSGHSAGGDAVWDIGLAHPDLWAGVIPIVATADKYVTRYWENAKFVPTYFVCGELDGDKMGRNGPQFDRYLARVGFDAMVTEYLGRGHEHFQEEQMRIFEWMNLHKREFFPKEFACVSMRPWDNFFWFLELRQFPAKTMVMPVDWPPPRNTTEAKISGKILENNGVSVDPSGAKATLLLAPEMVDFGRRIQINGRGRVVAPSVETLLEDVRTRGDRQHPFWARVDL